MTPTLPSIEARNDLVVKNRGLVYHVVNRLIRRRPRLKREYDDMVSAGFIALMRAAERFQPQLGFKFSTFACRAIQWEILHEADRLRTQVRYSSLDAVDADGTDRASILPDGRQAQPIDEASHREQRDCAEALLRRLPPRMAGILRARIMRGQTLKAIGEELGITKERVRQIELQAMNLLKKRVTSERLTKTTPRF
jgi:RNA polymerase sigma factor (sigma-70 family)